MHSWTRRQIDDLVASALEHSNGLGHVGLEWKSFSHDNTDVVAPYSRTCSPGRESTAPITQRRPDCSAASPVVVADKPFHAAALPPRRQTRDTTMVRTQTMTVAQGVTNPAGVETANPTARIASRRVVER